MTPKDIGARLVELLKSGDYETIYAEHYSPEAASVEADGTGSVGLDQIAKKNEWWFGAHEVHGFEIADWYPSSRGFVVIYDLDFTEKASGNRHNFREAGVYTVQDGKIVREEFYYHT
jgi:hypothetical protein